MAQVKLKYSTKKEKFFHFQEEHQAKDLSHHKEHNKSAPPDLSAAGSEITDSILINTTKLFFKDDPLLNVSAVMLEI